MTRQQESSRDGFLLAMLVVILLLTGALLWAVWSDSNSFGQVCESQDKTLTVVTEILQAAEAKVPAHLTAAQEVASEQFYASAFEKIAAARC